MRYVRNTRFGVNNGIHKNIAQIYIFLSKISIVEISKWIREKHKSTKVCKMIYSKQHELRRDVYAQNHKKECMGGK